MAATALSVRSLSKRFELYDRPVDRLKQTLWRGRRQFYREFWALRDVAFSLDAGQALGVVGRNGSGKSTLLQLVAGTLAPTLGEVESHGRVSALLELGSGFNPEFSGRENVFLNGAILGIERARMRELMDEILAFADIGDFIDRPVKTYSSGMALRLAFAVATAVAPRILIVDEALAVGDEAFQRKCFARIE
ncbi:MAG TPA: ABC transporter ATP-binding protein, partial [Casimicrobiaceae bacterium]|nr:ABC transporter ATP-binding protein [Casimicrobiaceae bacterium]